MKIEFNFVDLSTSVTYRILQFILYRVKINSTPKDSTFGGFTPRRDIEQRLGLSRALRIGSYTYFILLILLLLSSF